jgi:tetratricopeptide (TPR) repeat protein
MADNYGVTFAQKLLQRGDYEQAVVAAEQHAARDPQDPEPHHDRARALAALGRYEEAVQDYGRAIELDREAAVLPDWEVDDGLFSTVIAWGQALAGADEKLRALGRYKELLPQGSHLAEAEEWALRFRGLLPTTFIKPRD